MASIEPGEAGRLCHRHTVAGPVPFRSDSWEETGGKVPSNSKCLAPLGSKWLKTGIQLAFTRDGLCSLWNEMVNEGKLNMLGQNQPRMETSS